MELVADVAAPTSTMPTVLCCLCGVAIAPNPANMCVNCLRSQVDITEGIPKQIVLHNCRGCNRYLRPPWCACDLESRELLAICLKKVTGLGKVRATRRAASLLPHAAAAAASLLPPPPHPPPALFRACAGAPD
jgi:NMD protein affecting ribosome stability and mRNA decay